METVYLEPHQVPDKLRRGYTGRKFKAIVTDSVTINSQKWSGGSKDSYIAVNLETGERKPFTDPRPWPENMQSAGNVNIPVNFAVIEHSIFCGKDMGLTFYIRPDNVTALLPDNSMETFTTAEQAVLFGSARYKSSYNGQSRYEMTCGRAWDSQAARYADFPGVTEQEWNDAKATLISGKYLNKAGAITPKGRNAANNIKRLPR